MYFSLYNQKLNNNYNITMKNQNVSLLDSDQMARAEHDCKSDAKRVIIVGSSDIAESIKAGLKDIKIDVQPMQAPTSQAQIITIPSAPEIKVIEVPTTVVIKEIEYREIEKPVFITEVKMVEIEKPIFIKEFEIKEIEKQVIIREYQAMPSSIKYLLLAQTIALFIISLTILLKK